jgi:hypothetical protein
MTATGERSNWKIKQAPMRDKRRPLALFLAALVVLSIFLIILSYYGP